MDVDDGPSTPAKSPADNETDDIQDVTDVVEGRTACPTRIAKWLRIKNIYEKLHRPNIYDIGGTHVDNVPDFWFTCKTEKLLGIHLLHLFAGNHIEGNYNVAVGSADLLEFNDKEQNIYVNGKIEVYNLDCEPHNQCYVTTISFKNADVEDIIKNRKLYIAIKLSITGDTEEICIKEEVQLSHDYRELLKDPVGSDFIIESSDGKEYPVHRSVLSHSSDVFKAMLQDDMAESQSGRVKLVDVSNDIQYMLEFIYTSTLTSIENINLSNIIMLADKYNLLGLRKLCGRILIDQLDPDTALDILALADQCDCTDAKQAALRYIRRNKGSFKNVKFNDTYSIDLLKDLCAAIIP